MLDRIADPNSRAAPIPIRRRVILCPLDHVLRLHVEDGVADLDAKLGRSSAAVDVVGFRGGVVGCAAGEEVVDGAGVVGVEEDGGDARVNEEEVAG